MLIPGAIALSGRSAPQTSSEDDLAKQQERAARVRCAGYAQVVADQIQAYVSRFDMENVKAGTAPPAVPSIPKLRQQVTQLTARVGGEGCDAAVFRTDLTRKLDAVRARGPLGEAVTNTLVANVRDVLEPGTPRHVDVDAGADLGAAVAAAPSGSTLTLAAGRFALEDPLVVLQDLTLRGAGLDETTIVSTAADAVLLQAAPVRLVAADIAFAHRGRKPASVLVLRAGTARLDAVSVSDATARVGRKKASASVPDLAGGGNGIIALGNQALVLRDSVVHDNDASGVVASADARPRISETSVSGNGLCGVCFLGGSKGSVTTSTLRDNGIGVIVGNRARPTLHDNTVSGNQRAGMVTQERARPVVRANRFTDNGDIGIAVYGRSVPDLRGNTVTGHSQVGIVVNTDPPARPVVTGNSLSGNTQAGLVFLGRSLGRAVRNQCTGSSPGVVLGGTSRPDVTAESCPVRDERTG